IITQITYFTIMLFVLYLTIVNIKKENHFRRVEIETAQFTDYMRSLEVINNDMQKFRHDHANILASMQGYIEINDFEGLKKYFRKHIFSAEEDTLKRNMRLANLSKLQITGIKGLILTKTLQAEKEGITVNIEVPDVIDELSMNIIDIARILGIFLDNAIEANMQNHTDKEIDIAIFKSRSNSIMIIIENTIEDDHSVKIDKIFNDGFSTKGDNRGKGLSTVRSIINTYPNVVLRTNVNNGVFSQIIEMEKSEGSQ
ncbi:MAG TPA: GHKL domain-containing protein, partial [Niallia sp.]|nr:GHKL domain-containing protein [Niallia sp.]